MEPHLREHQYDYKETSGRVVQLSSTKRSHDDPSGEGETLRGKISHRMGDKSSFSKPTESLKKAFNKTSQDSIKETLHSTLYYPKTNETRSIYEQMLSMTQHYIGDCPEEILKDALDQVLATLKTEQVMDSDKKMEIEVILGKISDEVYNKFLLMSKQLIDYTAGKKERVEIEEMAINLDEEPEELIEEDEPEDLYQPGLGEIDADWLRKLLIPLFPDNVQEKELQVFEILATEDVRKCETRLVMALGFQNLDTVTTLITHKFTIFNSLRLLKCKTQEEKQAIIKELSQTPEGHKLVETLAPSGGQAIAPKRTLNLQALEFEHGAFTMTNQKLVLPPGHIRTTKPGYEEVLIPPNQPRTGKKIITHNQLPDFCKSAFTVKAFNEIQSKVFPIAYNSDVNMLVCAPTGAGKTNIGLMAILRLLEKHRNDNGDIDVRHIKIVYIAPMKALVSEICGNLSYRLEKYGVKVRELTGDTNISKSQIHQTQVIVSTPEKWDIITRKSGDRTFTDDLKLLIIDEVHLLHDLRGPVLEAIVARTLKLTRSRSQKIRIIGLSATLPNYTDVGKFLQVPEDGLFFFDKTYRPVPLQQRYIGITENKAIKRFLLMNEICYEKLMEQAGKNQVIIFVHSRKETVKTAKALRDLAIEKQETQKFVKDESKSKDLLLQISENVENQDVKELLPSGFCVHHAGLSKDDRKLIEDLFVDSHIQVLVSTATLAWGVNMPAHTVIIKGTQVYSPEKGTWIEISPQDLLQMIGRAGRMDYDSEGEGIIITTHTKMQYYLSLLNQQLPIESQMITQLADHLNAEVVLGNIGSLTDALDWIKLTYYPIRVESSPKSYGYDGFSGLDSFLVDVLHSAAIVLDKHGLVKYDKKLGIFTMTSLGQVASTYYIRPESISVYNEHIKPYMGPIDLLKVFGLSYEFKYIPVREEEKQEIAKLMEKVPYPIKGSMDEPASKMNVLLQCYISKLKLDGYTLMADMVYISQSAARIMRALFEICLRRGWCALSLISLNFYKMIIHRMWSVMSPLRQFNRLPEDLILKLEKKEGLTWDLYYDLTVQQITELLKAPTKSNSVYTLVRNFPKLLLNAYVQPVTRTCLRVELAINKDFEWDMEIHGNSQIFWILVEDVDGEVILHSEQFVMKYKHSDSEHLVVFTIPLFEPLPPQYFIRIVSDKWISCETILPVSFRHLILPEKSFAHSQIEDLIVTTESLKWPVLHEIIDNKYLSPLQAQVFEKLFKTQESLIFAGPDDTFKIGFIGILKALQDDTEKIVYLCQFPETAELVYRMLGPLRKIGENVEIMTGIVISDLRILGKGRIVVSCADYFEAVTRKWRQSKAVQNIRVVIADQLHLLGESGSSMEVVMSRMRFASTQNGSRLRILALSCSVTNANDLADWLGIKNIYSFPPTARTIPVSVVIESFDHNYRPSRLLAMSKPVYTAIKSYSSSDPVLIIVPDRKVGKTLALDLILYAAGDNFSFYKKKLEKTISKEKLITHALENGIGILPEDGKNPDILKMFANREIQILIACGSSCWGFTCKSKLAIIVDTCRFSGKEHRFQDYSIPEMLQIVSFCQIEPATAVVMCHSSRKEFLKKFLYEAYPVESHLDHYLEDHYNAEILNKTINTKQDAVDWITWTFMYRRLTQNPNYYNLEGVSGAHINDHLSELVENTLEALEKSKCIEVDDMDVRSTDLGMITAYYSIKCATADIFSSSITASSKIRSILEILVSSVELENFIVRPGEEKLLKELNSCLPEPLEKAYFNTPSNKSLLLLYAHFSRLRLTSELTNDTNILLKKVFNLIYAIVDISSSHGWLLPTIYSINLSQMITQALWDKDSPLMQLPFFTQEIVDLCKENNVEDIVDFMNIDDDVRNKILRLSQNEMEQVAQVCNAYPSISMSFDNKIEGVTGEVVSVEVLLEREGEYSDVQSSYFPVSKEELWWVIIGNTKTNRLFGIKKVKILQETAAKINFVAPEIGKHELMVYLLCSSYLGADQGEKLLLTVFA